MIDTSGQEDRELSCKDVVRRYESSRAGWWLFLWLILSVGLVAVNLVIGALLIRYLIAERQPCIGPMSVVITDPKEGDSVPISVTVRGPLPISPLPPDENLAIFVRSQNLMYWLQADPTVTSTGWYGITGIGVVPDPPGMSYRVCAVLTDKTLPKNQPVNDLPPGPSHCIEVKRK
jgi:hypothetical protein